MKSPLRYPGGKTRAIKILKDYIPKGTKEVTSPFLGGGSFELFLAEQGLIINAYDLFKPLVVFWQVLKTDRDNLVLKVESFYPLTKEKFYQTQKEIISTVDPLLLAAQFYVLNRCSFSGLGNNGGMSPNHPRFTPNQLKELALFEMPFDVNLESFEKSILNHEGLIFADPPYLIKEKLYGVKGDKPINFNHELLSETLIKKGNFILTYNDCPEIREMYKGCIFEKPSWAYGMNTSKISNEIIITN